MRVIVTGGAGFIGRALSARLIDDGATVTVIDSGHTGQIDHIHPSCEVILRDIRTFTDNDWNRLLRDTDQVFHLAARKYNTPGVTPEDLLTSNVEATWRLAEAAALNNVGRFVFTSSLYAYGSLGPEPMRECDLPMPRTLYGSSKLMGEHMIRTLGVGKGLNWNCARLFFIYGPGQFAEGGYRSVIVTNFSHLCAGDPPTVCGDGRQELDYVFIEDAVEALLRLSATQECSQTVNIASGQGYSINHVTKLMQEASGVYIAPKSIDPDWTAGTKRIGDPRAAGKLIGWKPEVTLYEGLERTWIALRSETSP